MYTKDTHIKTSIGWLSKTDINDWLDIHKQYIEGKSLVDLRAELKIRRATLKETFISFGLKIISKQESNQRRRETCLEKYGVDHISKLDSVINKKKETCLEKYGTEYCLQNKDVISKRRDTCLEKYGETTNLKTEETKIKIRKTCLEKYGVENATHHPLVCEKRKNTCLEKYGVDHPGKSSVIIEKRENKKREAKKIHIENILHDNGYELIDNFNSTRLYDDKGNYICWVKYNIKHIECGRVFEQDLHLVKNIKCPHCYPYQSSGELKLREIIKEITGSDVQLNSRNDIIPYKEIDIVIPELNVAFEYNGGFWHSMIQKNIFKNYHRNKTEECLKKDIKLYHVWEYSNDNIIRSLINTKLNNIKDRYYARKLTLKNVNINDRREFFNTNHLHGDVNSLFSIGLYLEDELISCISFRKNKEDIEIARFATKLNSICIGSFSRLLKHSIKHIKDKLKGNYNKIVTFCDRDWTPDYKDSVYYKNNFNFLGDSGVTLRYYDNKKKIYYSREKLQKYKLKELYPDIYDDKLTCDEMLSKKGIYPVYNSGNWKFELPI